MYPLFPLFPFVSQMWGWLGGGGCRGVMVFSHVMLFPTFLEKINSGNKKKTFSFNVFFVFIYAISISNIFLFFFINVIK